MKLAKQIFFVLLLLFLFSALLKNIFNYYSKLQFYQDFKKEYDKEKKENISLQTQILKKKSLDELEKNIRNKLNLLRPGEVAILLPTPTPSTNEATPTPAPNWVLWWKVFFK